MEKIEHKELSLSVDVDRADVLMGTRHTILVSQGFAEADEKEELAIRLVRLYTYPACIAATAKRKGFSEWPISFEDFCKLPEEFVVEWERSAYRQNPHWMPKLPESEEETEVKNVPEESASSS